ncbi:MAG: tetratricopeptide repeat protein [Bacillota bacterium]|nr:tetratricopeptide repeat protein [Bacillota bacterium]
MLIPVQLAGLAVACKAMQDQQKNKKYTIKSHPNERPKQYTPPANPFYSFMKGLSNSLTNPTASFNGQKKSAGNLKPPSGEIRKPSPNIINVVSQALFSKLGVGAKEDYIAVIKNSIPKDARILVPKLPRGVKEYEFLDIDGDKENELITSYIHDRKITTLILKRQNSLWNIAAEIKNSNYEAISYRGTADVIGSGKKQLLLGYEGKDNYKELIAYSLDNYEVNELFSHSYNRFHLLRSVNNNRNSNNHLAFWNKNSNGRYNIEVKSWNGAELELSKESKQYYYSRVLPIYANKLKQQPENPANWYNLAEALEKTGLYAEALYSVNIGKRQTSKPSLAQDFVILEDLIRSKLNPQ